MEPRFIIAIGIVLVTVLVGAALLAYRAHVANRRRRARRLQRQLEKAVESRIASEPKAQVHPWLEERAEHEPRVHPWIEPR
jgi:hypothetical protein